MKVLILGSGPAGLTAAIYAARGGLEPIVVAGSQPGGQLMLTTEVENYPGFEEPILGPDLMAKMRKQAERFGTTFVDSDAGQVDFTSTPFRIWADQQAYQGDAVILATGASAKWLDVANEQRLRGRGVSSCATCDGFFFKGKDVVVVGGGDTAVEEALFLGKLVNKVTLIHRREELRAQKIAQQRVFAHPKIQFLWNHVVVDILGQEAVQGVRLKHVGTGQHRELKCDGVFVAIGHKPNTDVFAGHVEIDQRGYVVRTERTMTSVPGVFVAGDVYDYTYRQAVTAAGSGCEAALDAIRWLEAQPES
jgi:thioredoxin reductase (NADPH)